MAGLSSGAARCAGTGRIPANQQLADCAEKRMSTQVDTSSLTKFGNKAITTAINLPAGYHEVSVRGTGHTDGSSTSGLLRMLVENGQGLNALRVIVEPSETILH